MTLDVVTVQEDTPISKVAELLFDRNLSGLPVLDKQGKLVGIVTEYDLLRRSQQIHIPSYVKLLTQLRSAGRAVAEQVKEIRNLKVKDIMTREVVVVEPEAEVAEVADIFSKQRI